MIMTMYKVEFSGYVLVEADSTEEAEELFYDDEWGTIETEIDKIVKYGD